LGNLVSFKKPKKENDPDSLLVDIWLFYPLQI
jgi:hypothetical protein